MTKRNQKPRKRTQKKRVPKPKSAKAGLSKQDRSKIKEAVCSQIDPFCDRAVGAKMYDESSWPSHTLTATKLVPVGTDANGNFALLFSSLPTYYFQTAAGFTGTVVSSWNTHVDIDNNAAHVNQFSYFRVVSSGLRFYSTVNSDADKGLVTIATDYSGSVTNLPDILATTFAEAERLPLRDCDITWVAMNTSANHSEYRSFSTSTPSEMPATSIALLGVTGAAASTTVGYVELVTHYECRATTTGYLGPSATPPAPHIDAIQTIAANVAKTMKPSHITKHISFGKKVLGAVDDAVDLVTHGLQYAPYLLALL